MESIKWRQLPQSERDRLRAEKHARWRREKALGLPSTKPKKRRRRKLRVRNRRIVNSNPDGCLAGTELKKLFSRLGFQERKNCGCAKHASQMDRNGCDWCEQNIDRIAGWIKYECKKRGLPFVRAMAVTVIRLAIRRARRKAESR